jgi:Cu(I)/Ag(I) efflux system membrane fusion protein
MNPRNRRQILGATLVAIVLVSLAGGYWLGRSRGHDSAAMAGIPAAPTAPEVLYWYDPMVPDQHFDKPGKSPFMDMELVPKYADGADDADPGGTVISPRVRQNLGIRTVIVQRGTLEAGLSVPGTLEWDLRREHSVSMPVDAVVQRLHVKAPYERVRAGEPLAAVLAPAWSTAIAEARALADARSDAGSELRSSARARLRVLGLPSGATVDAGGAIVLRAPVSGIASEIGVREGQAVPAGSLLVRLVDDRSLWLQAAIPQALAGTVAAGTPVTANVSAFPGRVFRGRVETLLPQVDPATRAQVARIVLDNREGLLAPGMFAQVQLTPAHSEEYPLVPTDALILGGGPARVIVQDENGRFRALVVQPGRSAGGRTEILSGLEGGERVVASGQFLIDSEASLSGALERLDTAPQPEPDASDGVDP